MGFIFGIGGLLLLLSVPAFGWSNTTNDIPTIVVSFLALGSIIWNLSVTLGICQARRRSTREALIAPQADANIANLATSVSD